MESQIDIECPYRNDVIKISTPMEFQIDVDCPYTPPWSFKLTWAVHCVAQLVSESAVLVSEFALLVSEYIRIFVSESAVSVSESWFPNPSAVSESAALVSKSVF